MIRMEARASSLLDAGLMIQTLFLQQDYRRPELKTRREWRKQMRHQIEDLQKTLGQICTICHEVTADDWILLNGCDHFFCAACFEAFLSCGGSHCPNCRALLSEYILVSSTQNIVSAKNAGIVVPDVIDL